WQTGQQRLAGLTGDEIMFGNDPHHRLFDAYRRWLATRPRETERIRRERPNGPLAITHYTGKRRNSPGIPRRYDALWLSEQLTVERIDHCYDEAIEAGSDHALVIADLTI